MIEHGSAKNRFAISREGGNRGLVCSLDPMDPAARSIPGPLTILSRRYRIFRHLAKALIPWLSPNGPRHQSPIDLVLQGGRANAGSHDSREQSLDSDPNPRYRVHQRPSLTIPSPRGPSHHMNTRLFIVRALQHLTSTGGNKKGWETAYPYTSPAIPHNKATLNSCLRRSVTR